VVVALFAGLVLAGCRGETCARHSDCAAGEVCELGDCIVPCSDDGDCPLDQACSDGRCGEIGEAGRHEPCDADAGCTDAVPSPDAAPATPDAAPPRDGAPPADATPGRDGAVFPDAGPPVPDATLPGDDGAVPDATPPDAGAPDATSPDAGAPDAGPVDLDAAVPDATPPDATPGDAVPPDAASDAAVADAAPPAPDGAPTPRAIDLAATYTVTRTVLLSGDPRLQVGSVQDVTARVRRVARPIYRIELLNPNDQIVGTIEEARFFFPEGREMFQLTFDVPDELVPPAPAGCTRHEAWFERGDLAGEEPYTLNAIAEQHVTFDGEACDAEDFLIVYATAWVPIGP
jgi:hypothetical protein